MTPRRTAAVLLLCLAGAASAAEPATFPAEEFDALLATYALVKAQYVETADDKKLLGGAIAGMLASLDPHSHYLAQRLDATLAAPEAPAPLQRAAVESTRIFGTDDDRALAAAVALLAPRPGAPALMLGP